MILRVVWGKKVREERSLEERQMARRLTGLQAGIDSQLAVDVLQMVLHGVDRNDQFLRNLLIALPGNQQLQHPLLLERKWLNQPVICRGSYGNGCSIG